MVVQLAPRKHSPREIEMHIRKVISLAVSVIELLCHWILPMTGEAAKRSLCAVQLIVTDSELGIFQGCQTRGSVIIGTSFSQHSLCVVKQTISFPAARGLCSLSTRKTTVLDRTRSPSPPPSAPNPIDLNFPPMKIHAALATGSPRRKIQQRKARGDSPNTVNTELGEYYTTPDTTLQQQEDRARGVVTGSSCVRRESRSRRARCILLL